MLRGEPVQRLPLAGERPRDPFELHRDLLTGGLKHAEQNLVTRTLRRTSRCPDQPPIIQFDPSTVGHTRHARKPTATAYRCWSDRVPAVRLLLDVARSRREAGAARGFPFGEGPLVLPDTLRGLMHLDSGIRTGRALSRLADVALLVIVLMSATAGVASGVVGGKTVSITAAPWTVVVWEAYEPGHSYAACTGVIIDPRHVLTAGHCVMQGDSARTLPLSAFRIEAGVSSFKHPRPSDNPQFRAVRDVRVMRRYIAFDRLTVANDTRVSGHDLAVVTLSRPLDRAASMLGPQPCLACCCRTEHPDQRQRHDW